MFLSSKEAIYLLSYLYNAPHFNVSRFYQNTFFQNGGTYKNFGWQTINLVICSMYPIFLDFGIFR